MEEEIKDGLDLMFLIVAFNHMKFSSNSPIPAFRDTAILNEGDQGKREGLAFKYLYTRGLVVCL